MKKTVLCLLLSLSLFPIKSFAQPIAPATKGEKPQSEWVYNGTDGKLIYKKTPAGDRIIDFSYAGYMGGGVALPHVPAKISIKSSGNPDETATIQAAIDKVAAMPLENGFHGAVVLEVGTYVCSDAINIPVGGIVLRGSGSGVNGTIIKMTGSRHTAIVIGKARVRQQRASDDSESPGNQEQAAGSSTNAIKTKIAESYVPSGATSFSVIDATIFTVGDEIEIRRPVTAAWVKFMQMDNLKRDGKPQTWIREGTNITTQRKIMAISGNTITIDVPLSDSFDSNYLNPPGTEVAKAQSSNLIAQSAVEHLRIQAPPMEMSYQQAPYTALRINGQDCWAQDIAIEETMNSVSIGGRRITLERVAIDRTVPNLGASKPAEFAPNASQVLLDRCSSNGNNIWHVATGAGQTGPIVLLYCIFGGNGRIEGHQRWTTGMLLDNCRLQDGGIDFKNRGAMGSGHGWGTAWSVAWNCIAKSFVVQQPPGAFNWMIGCIGPNVPTPQPFDSSPDLPLGISDSPQKPVAPQSLYLAQLAARLGPQALKNIGYSSDKLDLLESKNFHQLHQSNLALDSVLGVDVASHKLANASNVRRGDPAFGGERALDDDPNTYWSTNDSITKATLEIDIEEPHVINTAVIQEAKDFLGRVQEYKVEGQVDSGWKLLSHGTTIGERKVDHFSPVLAWKVRLTILKSSTSPAISTFSLYQSHNFPIDAK